MIQTLNIINTYINHVFHNIFHVKLSLLKCITQFETY